MAISADALDFEKGEAPETEVKTFSKDPMVLRFSPVAYRNIVPDELDEWKAEVADRLGLDFDIGGSSGGTVSFCQRGGTGAAYRCDCDLGDAIDLAIDEEPRRMLRKWDSTPIALQFPPKAYAAVSPRELETWKADLKDQLGLDFDIGGGSGGTISFCQRGGTGAAYRCDSDID